MTNIVLLTWLFVSTNTEVVSRQISEVERDQVTRIIEYRALRCNLNGTPRELPLATNVLLTVQETLRYDGTNWIAGPPVDRTVPLPPMPPVPPVPTVAQAQRQAGPRRPRVRYAIPDSPPPDSPPPLPTAEELRRAELWDKHR